MNYLLALLPIAIYLAILKALDSFILVRRQRLVTCIAWGMSACALTIAIENLASPQPGIFPPLEEMLKAAMAVHLICRRKIFFLAESLCYGAAIGAGFAIVENITYLFYNPDMTGMTAFFRGICTALMHMGSTAIVTSMAVVIGRTWAILLGLCAGIALHCVYNMFLLTNILQMILFVVILIIIFVLLSEYNERRIYRWMDHSITSDVQLLMAIKQGRLTDTGTGKYLLSVKEQFKPEVFFDIVCYMQLYLELVIQGKSRMLLHQQGLDIPLPVEEQNRHAEMLKELNTLERNIGIIGKHVLRPVVRFNREDLAILN